MKKTTANARAAEVLEILEKGEEAGSLARLADDLPLFRAARRAARVGALAVRSGVPATGSAAGTEEAMSETDVSA